MANITGKYNKYKPMSSKGYYGIIKAVVTRNYLHLPIPITEENKEYVNPYNVQVWIPAYHGIANSAIQNTKTSSMSWSFATEDDEGKEIFLGPDPELIGTKDDPGVYPWAQVCTPIFKDQIGDRRERENFPDIWSSMFYGKYNEDLPVVYPAVGDVVFIMFENGDADMPIVVGSLVCDANRVRYKNYKDHDEDFLYYEEYDGYPGNIDEPLLGGAPDTTIPNLSTRLEGIDVENEDLDKEDKEEEENEDEQNSDSGNEK